jgi:ribosomal protein S18 acetylase RimI-like enzyme
VIEIRPLTRLNPAALQTVISGYASPARFAVSRIESSEETAITLRLVPLEQPYIRRYEPLDALTLRRYRRVLAGGFSLGAFESGRLVGVALAEPHHWNRTLWVWEFHVAAGHRGQGIGRRLMETLAEKGRAAGLRAIVCETQNTNVPAIRFYRALGFSLQGVDLSYYTNEDVEAGEVAVFMKRRLA